LRKSRIEDVPIIRTERRQGIESLIITLGREQRRNSPHREWVVIRGREQIRSGERRRLWTRSELYLHIQTRLINPNKQTQCFNQHQTNTKVTHKNILL